MNKNSVYGIASAMLVILSMLVGFSSCNDIEEDEYTGPVAASLRDGVFSAEQCDVFVNGEKLNTIKTVTMRSVMKNPNVSHPDENTVVMDPDFDTKFVMQGFPKASQTSEIYCVTTFDDFEGTATINGVQYSFTGEFEESPLLHHDKQRVIFHFITE